MKFARNVIAYLFEKIISERAGKRVFVYADTNHIAIKFKKSEKVKRQTTIAKANEKVVAVVSYNSKS